MKTCFKCKTSKDFSCFYKHEAMSDGYLGKCKECTKRDVHQHRDKNIDKIREYDRGRGSRQSAEYRKSDSCKESMARARKKWNEKNPHKKKAQGKVATAIRNGSLLKDVCKKCGHKNTQAHHENYNEPLNIVWLCKKHHMERHKEINEEGRK